MKQSRDGIADEIIAEISLSIKRNMDICIHEAQRTPTDTTLSQDTL
jgi:hypothetical protein